MKCPLRHLEYHTEDHEQATVFMDCLKEKCAWWDSENGRCALLSAYVELDTLTNLFGEFVRKMPHAGQFTK